MGIDNFQNVGDLQNELDHAKYSLFVLNDNIRRIIGKDLRIEKHKLPNETKRNDGDRQVKHSDQKFKKRIYESKSVFNRLSAPIRSADEETKPRLNSRVIREMPTRQEILEAQGADSESRARNRRMFGSLLGTLHKFTQEESRLKQREDKKAQVEKKLEEQEILERESLKKEREMLFMERKKRQLDIKRLEQKMSRLQDFSVWERTMSQLKNHIKTNTKPHIYFKPRVMSKKTQKMVSESKLLIENMVSQKLQNIDGEINSLDISFKTHEYENDEYLENLEVCSEEIPKKYNYKSTDESIAEISIAEKVPTGLISLQKDDVDFKENNVSNLNEPAISSSIVVVKNYQNQA